MIEAELMTLFTTAFQKMNIEIIIKYNSRNLTTGLILECGVPEDQISVVTTIIDKIEKISEEEFKNNLLELNLNEDQIKFLKECFSLSLKGLNEKFENTINDKINIGLKELNELTNYLEQLGIASLCEFTPSLARGQNYYTGNVFEVYEKNYKLTGSIGGGGRYDKMITNFINDGEEYPAVGISFGLSSIYELLKNKELSQNKSSIDIYIIPMDTNSESLKLANDLRNLNYKVEIEMQKRKLKKSLDYANRENIPYVIILGEAEILEEKFKLKDMFNGNEIAIDFSNLQQIKDIIKNETI